MSTTQLANSPRSVRPSDFADRLHQASDAVNVPPMNLGRLTWLRRQLHTRGITVSVETVRKWYAGEARPKPQKFDAIVDILGVNWSWLAGAPDMEASSPRSDRVVAKVPSGFRRVPLADVSNQMASILDSVSQGKPILIDRDGRPQAVVIGFDEWRRLSKTPSLGQLLMTAPTAGDELPPRSQVSLRSFDY